MIVEFVGESGCGKSTLAKNVFPNIEGAKRKGSLTTKDNLKALMRILSRKKTRKIFNAYLSLEIAEIGLKRFLRNNLYIAGLINVLTKNEKQDVWIIDQGLIQFLQTVYFFKSPKNERFAKIIAMLTEDNDYVVVACGCDHETLIKRIQMRRKNDKETERRIEHADSGLFDLHEKNLRTILERISKKDQIFVDTAQDMDTITKEVCNFIESRRMSS